MIVISLLSIVRLGNLAWRLSVWIEYWCDSRKSSRWSALVGGLILGIDFFRKFTKPYPTLSKPTHGALDIPLPFSLPSHMSIVRALMKFYSLSFSRTFGPKLVGFGFVTDSKTWRGYSFNFGKSKCAWMKKGTVSLRSLLHLVAPLPLAFFKARRRVWKGATTGN